MEIRLAGYLDADAIIRLDPVVQNDRIRVNFIHQTVTSRNCYMALIDKQAVGYGVLDYSFFGHGFVSMLYVGREFRRQGVGSGLMRHMERTCKTGKLFTTVHESNTPLHAFLEKLDYRPSGAIENLADEGCERIYFICPRKGT